jgi:prophage regulatory protein
MAPSRLIGISVIARRLAISRQRVHVLASHNEFPAPAHHLETGRVWHQDDIERWIARNPRYDHSPRPTADRYGVIGPEGDQAPQRWRAWCAFCDGAIVAPDTLRTPEDLAARYERETGTRIDPEAVRALMPEHRP